MFGAKKQVLLVGNDGVHLYLTQGKRTTLWQDFSHEGGNLSTALRKAFKQNNAPLILLFDVAEQQYRKETIPKIGILDKKKIINRRLQLAFPQQQMRAFLPLQKSSKEGESMVALFGALSPNLTIVQIMDAVLGSEITVKAGLLLPVESTGLVTQLRAALSNKGQKLTSRWTILMTYQKTGGLRQIVTKDGELALTRLTPLAIDPYNSDELAEEMSRELGATMTYLSRFGYAANDGLDLFIVGSEALCDKIKHYALPVGEIHAMLPFEAARLVGLSITQPPEEAVFGDILHAAWTGSHKPLMKLSAPLMDRVQSFRNLARAGIITFLAAALVAGYLATQLQAQNMALDNEISDLNAKKIQQQAEFDALTKKLNTLKYPPEQTKAVLNVYQRYAQEKFDAEPALAKIIGLIDKSVMALKHITTSVTSAAAPADPSAPPALDAAGNPVLPVRTVTISIDIGFQPTLPLEKAAEMTNTLAEDLHKQFPKASVTISKIVGNIAINQTMQGFSEQIAQNKIEGRLVKEDTSTLIITGVIE